MHRLDNESREEPRRKGQGTQREIKELQYRSNLKEELMEEPLQRKGSRYLNFLSQKNITDIEEGLNGCVTDSLSESL